MSENTVRDLHKIWDAVNSIRKTLQCTRCERLLQKPVTGKCGHPYCRLCIRTLGKTTQDYCNICKTVINTRNLRQLDNIQPTVENLQTLIEAIEKDSGTSYRDFRNQRPIEQYQRQSQKSEAYDPQPGSSVSEVYSGLSSKKPIQAEKEIAASKISDSVKSIGIPANKSNEKGNRSLNTRQRKSGTNSPIIVLPEKLDNIKSQEKVHEWLNSEDFMGEDSGNLESCQNLQPTVEVDSPTLYDGLKSFSQTSHRSDRLIEHEPKNPTLTRSERSLKNSEIMTKHQENLRTENSHRKFKSFTSEAIQQRSRTYTKENLNQVSKAVRPSETIFNILMNQSVEQKSGSKKLKGPSISNEDSWSELESFKKEARSKVRKRKRLNVSIERPHSSRHHVNISDPEEFEEGDQSKIEDFETAEDQNSRDMEANQMAHCQKQKPNLVSYRILEANEMIDVTKLNKRQVKDIIGVSNKDRSNDSSLSLEESPVKSLKNKLSLKKSGASSQDINRDPISLIKPDEKTNFDFDKSTVQAKQSIETAEDNTRPHSSLSHKGSENSKAEKLRHSTQIKTATLTRSPSKVMLDEDSTHCQLENQDATRIATQKPSIIKKCSDRLSLSGSSNRGSINVGAGTNVRYQILGKLHKPRKLVKFWHLGPIKSNSSEYELQNQAAVLTCDAQTQTSSGYTSSPSMVRIGSQKIIVSRESSENSLISATPTTLTTSNLLKKRITANANTSSRIEELQEPLEELNTLNKDNMLSPEKDSQLKYLATESHMVGINRSNSDGQHQTNQSFSAVTRESSFANSIFTTKQDPDYMTMMKKCAEKLLVTDSEIEGDPDITSERFYPVNQQTDAATDVRSNRMSATTSSAAPKTVSEYSSMKDDISVNKSPSLQSMGNYSEKSLSNASPRRKKFSKRSSTSATKRRSAEELKSQTKISNQTNDERVSEAETILLKPFNKTYGNQYEVRESVGTPPRHKVVRKLKYSQESGSSSDSSNGKIHSLNHQRKSIEEHKSACLPAPNSFKKIHKNCGTDTEDDDLVVSLSPSMSSSHSQNVMKSVPSQQTNKSSKFSEDISLVLTSLSEKPESGRKRSLSPACLDTAELQARASNWCAELERSPQEMVMGKRPRHLSKNPSPESTLKKKPKFDNEDSPTSSSNDSLPILNQTVFYGNQEINPEPMMVDDTVKKVKEISHQQFSSSTGENESSSSVIPFHSAVNVETDLIMTVSHARTDFDSAIDENLMELASHFDSIDKTIQAPQKSPNALSNERKYVAANSSRHVTPTKEKISSIQSVNIADGMAATNENLDLSIADTPEAQDILMTQRLSHNSDKENDSKRQDMKKRVTNDIIPENFEQQIKTETSESSFERDNFNITQEEAILLEFERNILGQKSSDALNKNIQNTLRNKASTNAPERNHKKDLRNILSEQEVAKEHQLNLVDSLTVGEEIIESTPEKSYLPSKKDFHSQIHNSQRSDVSRKSFRSVDITPISNRLHKSGASLSTTPLVMRNEKSSAATNSKVHPLYHSTPKPTTLVVSKTKLGTKNNERKLCFVCSCLTLSQVQTVKELARTHNADYTAVYKPEVTHLIVEENETNSASRTLKYLLSVAHKKWILSYRWVADSMNQKRLKQEEDYEVLDNDSLEPGPRRSRLRTRGLFEEYAFVCMEPFSDISLHQVKDIVTSTGGTVVGSLEALSRVTKKYKIILYNSERYDLAVLQSWLAKGRALPVLLEWVLACVGQYGLTSLYSYLHTLDPQLALDLGFPDELVAEDDDSCSLNDDASTSHAA
ncbi:breast cancer type 1 susceptibility protein homolog [Athalia rosae]|uniref:breast cancer type 1 susceptibility protein homolog n=1 Tax=Athalia rosae TaxID=37344 RepID=UPI002033B934|nr:breast cancer type 1 susceptibility protein homolog [Athalia rosae]